MPEIKNLGKEVSMKKLLVVVALAGAGYAAWKHLTTAKEDRDLWAAVTDAVRAD
jgi:hypothetical protein